MIGFRETTLEDLAIDHEIDVNTLSGSARLSVPIKTSPGRESFSPQLALAYGSGERNSTFGVGWFLSGISSIGLDTTRRLPTYQETTDRYVYAGGQELIPYRRKQGSEWLPVVEQHGPHRVQRFRSKIERSFERFEKWSDQATGRVHWLVYARNGVMSVFGAAGDDSTRIADPSDPDRRTFQWLLEAQYDRKGNAILYQYKGEDGDGVDPTLSFESRRVRAGSNFAQRYLKRIVHGNSRPLAHRRAADPDNEWRFEIVFDYGEHAVEGALPTPSAAWTVRKDPFSTHRCGFELRSYRLCRRVLMFHRFPELGDSPCLVGATELTHREQPGGSVLETIRYRGYRKDLTTGATTERATPPLTLTYSAAQTDSSFEAAEPADNVPAGLDGAVYQWVDLKNEGLPGILHRRSESWYFKENLGDGRFGPLEVVDEVPAAVSAAFQLNDFDGNGNLDLVGFEGREAGHYQRDRDTGRWEGFRTLHNLPRVDLANARVQWVDLNGDGHADLVVDHSDRLVWYPSEGADGFSSAIELAKPDAGNGGAPTLTQDRHLHTFFADMTGDGLLDMVRVDSGRIEYWPHLGHGRFGTGVVMENTPVIDRFGELDAGRLRFADLDGNGAADLIYIGNGEVRYWLNQSGNSFSAETRLSNLPYIDRLSSAQIFDFLGDGTPCLVWSTPLPAHEGQAIHYLRLTGGVPPRMLLSVANGIGREARISYRSSAREYLRDKRSGQSWRTRIPRHSIVVDRLEGIDRVAGTRMVTRYEYRDGYFDSEERRFLGFGQVDAYDTDLLRATGSAAPEEVTPPSLVRSWYHTGAYNGFVRRAADFYSRDALAARLPDPSIEGIAELTTEEQLDAYRVIAGVQWRQEFYTIDPDGTRAIHPLRTTEFAYRIRRLQPLQTKGDTVFCFVQSELLSHEYEQDPSDPRIRHDVMVESDSYGNVAKRVSLAYPRRLAGPAVRPEQRVLHAELSHRTHTSFDDAVRFEVGIEIEERRYFLTGLTPGTNGMFAGDALVAQIETALANGLDFHEIPGGAAPQARLIAMRRNCFWNDARSVVLPVSQVGAVTLLHHVERAVLPEAAVAAAYEGRVDGPLLSGDGHYRSADGHWWAEDTAYRYQDASRFYRLAEESGSGGNRQTYTFDAHALLVTAIEDVFGSRVESVPDYQVLASSRVKDANDNVSETLYDPLGVSIVTTLRGEQLGTDGMAHPVGAESLDSYVVRTGNADEVLADPGRFLQNASRFLFYDLEAFERRDGPPRSIYLEREQSVHDGEGTAPSAGRIRITVSYVDGFGRAIQTKVRGDPGPAIQRDAAGAVIVDVEGEPVLAESAECWLTSGHDVYNNKGWLVRNYEPLFSPNPDFESDDALRVYGVSARTHYDPVGRVVRQDLPNGTFVTSSYTAWETRRSDANDNVIGSDYEAARQPLPVSDPEKAALTKAQAHARTPAIVENDALGRPFRARELGEGGVERITTTIYGVMGLPDRIIDARNLTAFTYRYDMLGRVLFEHSMDAGDRFTLLDAHGRVIHRWDGRGVHQEHRYDQNGRPTETRVDGALGLDNIVERFVYGDNPVVSQAALRNARGRAVECDDDAGVLRVDRYHMDGQVLETRRFLRNAPDAHKTTVDWSTPAAVALDAVEHRTQSRFDALGRVVAQSLPDGTTREYDYAALGHVAEARITTADGQLQRKVIATAMTTNARGQRTRLRFGNGVETSYAYDAETFRLQRLHTRRVTGVPRDYLDVAYTYDPVGNITRWIDRVQDPGAATPLIRGLTTTSACEFTYDPFYQLKAATGRVHQALLQHDYRAGLSDSNAIKGTRHLTLNDGSAIERYTRLYDYDLAGNIERIRHQGVTRNWTTEIRTSPTSNRSLPRKDLNDVDVVDPELHFDGNGNTIGLPHLRGMDWNHDNRLARAVIIDRSAVGQPDDAEYYVYGADGLRVRRVTERLVAGQLEVTEATYFEGCEIRRIALGGTTRLLRATSHITDGSARLATLHQWTIDQTARETDDITRKKLHYLVSNHLGSVSLELDDAGEVISYEEYFPYGGTSFIAGPNARDVQLKDVRYSGKLHDDATGFYCYEYRYYAPFIGGWLSPDPLGAVDGLNLYRFVHNNPIRFVDANGLESDVPKSFVKTSARRTGTHTLKEELDLKNPSRESYEAVKAYAHKYLPKSTVVWSTSEAQWLAVFGDLETLPDAAVVPDEEFFTTGSGGFAGDGTGEGEGKDTGSGHDNGDSTSKGEVGGGDKSSGTEGAGAEEEKKKSADGSGKSKEAGKTEGEKGKNGSGAGSTAGKDKESKSGGGAPGGAPADAPDAPPAPPGVPTSPGGIPYDPDAEPPEILPESGTPNLDPGQISPGAGEGDGRGEPGSEAGSAVRPGGVAGGSVYGTAEGTERGTAAGAPDGSSGGAPGGQSGGLRGGSGWLTLPSWLAAPLNFIADKAAAIVDVVQTGLDVVGLIPGLGEIADGLNGLISLARGDYAGAALSFAAMVPFAGWAATAGKFGRRAVKAAGVTSDVARAATKYGDEAASVAGAVTRNADEAAQFAGKNADELAKTGSDYVLRAVRPDELADIAAGRGIRRGAGRTNPTQQVLGVKHKQNPWVSATRSPAAADYFATHGFTEASNAIVRIDLTKLSNRVLDVSTKELAQQTLLHPRAVNFSAAFAEVLIHGSIPSDAIEIVYRGAK